MPNFGELQAQQAAIGAGLAALAITPGASPYSYTATRAGRVYVSIGTVTAIETGRNGTFINHGVVAGVFPVSAGDVLRVTYAVAPTMTFMAD